MDQRRGPHPAPVSRPTAREPAEGKRREQAQNGTPRSRRREDAGAGVPSVCSLTGSAAIDALQRPRRRILSYRMTNRKYFDVVYVISGSQSVLYESAGIRRGRPGDSPVRPRQLSGPGIDAGPFLTKGSITRDITRKELPSKRGIPEGSGADPG